MQRDKEILSDEDKRIEDNEDWMNRRRIADVDNEITVEWIRENIGRK